MLTSLPKSTTIIKIIEETSSVKTFILDKEIKAKPGQFLMIWLPRIDERPFSIVEPDPLTLTVAKVGPFTTKMHRLKIGDKMWYRGPLGNPFKLQGENILLVAGGYGVAPLYFLAKEVCRTGRKPTVIVGAKSKKSLLFIKRFKKLECTTVIATEDNSVGINGKVTKPLLEILKRKKFDQVYACGPGKMLEAVVKICGQRKIAYQVSMEAVLKCGLGLCGSCSRDGKLVCKDGPVFSSWPEWENN